MPRNWFIKKIKQKDAGAVLQTDFRPAASRKKEQASKFLVAVKWLYIPCSSSINLAITANFCSSPSEYDQ